MSQPLPEEVLETILANFSLPPATTIASKRSFGEPEFESIYDLGCHDIALRQNLATLATCGRVSRAFSRIVEPLLYRSYGGHRLVDPLAFITGLAARSGRGDMVRDLVIDPGVHYIGPPPVWARYLTRLPPHHGTQLEGREGAPASFADRDIFAVRRSLIESDLWAWKVVHEARTTGAAEASERLHVGFLECFVVLRAEVPEWLKRKILEKFVQGEWDAIHSVIVLMCPNIEHLSLSLGRDYGWSLLQETISWIAVSPSSSPASFSALKTIHVCMAANTSSSFRRDHPAITPLLQAPALQELKIEDESGLKGSTADDFFGGGGEVLSASLRVLHLKNCAFDAATLGKFLHAFPSLESLEVVYTRSGFDPALGCFLDGARIGNHLRRSGHGLVDLILDSRPVAHFSRIIGGAKDIVPEGLGTPLGELRGLDRMKSLSATPRALLGKPLEVLAATEEEHEPRPLVDILPPNLQVFTMLGDIEVSAVCVLEPDAEEQMRELLASDAFPHLSTVRVHGYQTCPILLSHSDWSHSLQYHDYDFTVMHVYERRSSQ
jgi:hypothetical protein